MKNRWNRDTAFALVILGLFATLLPLGIMEKSAEKELAALTAKQKELVSLSGEYRELKENVDFAERKTSPPQIRGVADALDSVSSSLGIRSKVKSVKGVSNREIKGSMNEESAEVLIEKVTLNELVNLFYRIGDAPMILSVKKVTMKKSFESPELLDVTMTMALFTRK